MLARAGCGGPSKVEVARRAQMVRETLNSGGRQLRVLRAAVLLAVQSVCWLLGQDAACSQAAAPITTLKELYSLSADELAAGRRFKVEGTVLCFDPQWNQLFIASQNEVIYLNPSGLRAELSPGDELTVTANTCALQTGIPLTNVTAVVRGHLELPPAKEISIKELAKNAGLWVELSGEVRVAERSRERLVLVVRQGADSCQAPIMGVPPSLPACRQYAGSHVRVRGINVSVISDGRTVEARLMVPDLSQVSILEPPKVPLSEVPVISIEALLNRELGPWTNSPVHLNGVVLNASPGEALMLKDPTGLIQSRVTQVNRVSPGERVDLWGYLQPSAEQPVLVDGYFESTPRPTSARAAGPATFKTDRTNEVAVATIAQLRSLAPEKLAGGVPIRFKGTLLYNDSAWNMAFFHDGTCSCFAELKQTGIEAGQTGELSGSAAPGNFAPVIVPATFRAIGSTNLPSAPTAALRDLGDGHMDAQWIRLQGVVHSAVAEDGHLRLWMTAGDGKFKALIPNFNSNKPPAGLIGSQLEITGACGSDLNARNQVTGITLYVPSLDCIKILAAADVDPFKQPIIPISTVATFQSGRASGQRARVRGIITLRRPGQGLFLQDASGGIRVEPQRDEGVDLEPGDTVEVVGYPALGDFSPHLEDALLRKVRTTGVPAPVPISAEQILLNGANDSTLVRLEARLLQRVPSSAQPKLLLQEGPIIFTAQLARGNFTESVSRLRPGALVRVTGVCVIQSSDDQIPQSFRLLLPDADSFQVLSAPPLLSLRQWLLLMGLFGLAGLAALVWIVALRRQVHARTAELRASQDTLKQEFERGRAFSELGHRLSAAQTPKEAANIIVEIADRLIGWDACICDLYNPELDLMTHVLNIDQIDGTRRECQPNFVELPPSALARRAIDSGGQLTLRRPEEPAGSEGIVFGDNNRRSASLLYVPIRNGNSVVAVLSVQSYSFDAYDEEDLKVLQALADHCSGTLERIRANQQLVQLSRQAGMAEIATGVLHNVGNVLNSVNVSVTLLQSRGQRSHSKRLMRILELLSSHSQDLAGFLSQDPTGRKIPEYLNQLNAALPSAELQDQKELESLVKNVEHIKDIVGMQQSYARIAGYAEKVSPAELIEDALRLSSDGLARRQIEVAREYSPGLPVLTVDKHKVLQILVNLVRNAQHACEESGRPDKKLTISLDGSDQQLRIIVADNGIGIAPENLNRIFTLGFSTRKNGHGFGLHSGALAAQELGGSLNAQSAGPGAGATFTLELPVSPPV